MPVRRTLMILLALVLGATLAGCGGDDKDDAASSTATSTTPADEQGSSDTTITAPEEPPAPTTTLSADDFDAAIAASKAQLTDAGDDFCTLANVAGQLIAESPQTPEQAKALYELYADMFNKLGDAAPPGSEADATAIKAAATAMLEDAEASGYDPAKLSTNEAPAAFSDPAVTEAMSNLGKVISEQCLGVDAG